MTKDQNHDVLYLILLREIKSWTKAGSTFIQVTLDKQSSQRSEYKRRRGPYLRTNLSSSGQTKEQFTDTGLNPFVYLKTHYYPSILKQKDVNDYRAQMEQIVCFLEYSVLSLASPFRPINLYHHTLNLVRVYED